jgi:hypothetical protein
MIIGDHMIIKKKYFGVYYFNELIDTIEATSLEEAKKIALSKLGQVPAQLKYKGKIIDETNIYMSIDQYEDLMSNFHVKPLKER